MKNLYFLFAFLLSSATTQAQCNIDTVQLASSLTGMYPAPNHLPHIVRDSLYDQTVQGKIIGTIDTVIMSFVAVHLQVDSVILDSIGGLPNGITWSKNPNVLLGGGYGCVEFSGTTSDAPGVYNLSAFGTAYVHIIVPLLGLDTLEAQQGSLMRFPPFNRYSLTVDSVQQPLAVTVLGRNDCYGETNGTATANATGGSPVNPYNYLWNTGGTGYTLSNLAAGTYTVTAYSGSDSSIASYIVTTPLAPITGSTTAVGSNGTNGVATVTVTGGEPPYTYRWNGNHPRTDTITGLAPGTYRVTVTDSSGCAFVDSAVVANLTGLVSINADVLQMDMFPNPANSILNISLETDKTLALQLETIDMTGRVIYSAPVNANNRTNLTLNLEKYNTGMYILQLTGDNVSLHQRFIVAH